VTQRATTVFALATASLIVSISVALAGMLSPSPERSAGQVYRLTSAVKPLAPPFLMFETLGPPRAHGRVAMTPATADGTRALTTLRCSRLSYAGGRGLCLTEEVREGIVKTVAYVFGRTFQRGARFELPGVATRVRVAPAGDVAAVTTYAEEESPAGERLAIETVLIDLRTARAIADLREFHIDAPGGALTGPFDFASVAFDRDGDRFFATLSTPNTRYVVVGSIRNRQLRPIAPDVVSEALSPDGTRLIVKRRVGDRGFWELGVLDLSSLVARRVDQGGRSVDDQVEWLDDDHLLYHDASDAGTSIWVVAADGQSPPRVLVPEAFSPVVVR
jgi:hypothetical protein